ncbi:MAG: DUF3300 domain-containing protein [Fibrobacter sp.]|nr:DUF3300 domain-containing protein [Fibrobacter sp.]
MLNAKTNTSKWLWIVLAAFLCLPVTAKAADGFTNNELDTLVSTIALYPDPLLVHVLTAATYGDQIPRASAWAEAHKNLNGEALATAMENANLKYDPSVQALIPFPTILATMAKYRTWSDQLGDAVSFQKDQVLDAIQRMRQVAYKYGHLKTDDQVVVTKTETIVIEPTRTEYVYVPVYNPQVVYYVYADHYHPAVRYHHHAWLGTWYGEWGWGTCWFDWQYRYIYVRDYRWYPHRPIPHHPHRYNPPPRKPNHYRQAPPPGQKKVAPQPPREDKNLRSRAASAKNSGTAVVRDRNTHAPARVEANKKENHAPARVETKTEKHAPARVEAKQNSAPRRESSTRRSSSDDDDNSSYSSSRRSTGTPARVERRSDSRSSTRSTSTSTSSNRSSSTKSTTTPSRRR